MAKKGSLRSKIRDSDERPSRPKKYKFLILIVCEDQKTEKDYFESFQKQFPDDTIYQRTVGTGLDPLGVVGRALEERTILSEEAKRDVDETWVVFDKDDADLNDTRRQRYDAAFTKANQEGLKLADSNEVFELWLLLHLQDVDPEKVLPRQEVYTLLGSCVSAMPKYAEYQYIHKENKDILTVIAEVGSESDAIRRAKVLWEFHKDRPRIEANPSTRVHCLVLGLREWIAYFSFDPDE